MTTHKFPLILLKNPRDRCHQTREHRLGQAGATFRLGGVEQNSETQDRQVKIGRFLRVALFDKQTNKMKLSKI